MAAKAGAKGLALHYDFPCEDVPEFVQTFATWLQDEHGIAPTDEMRVAMYAHAANGGIKIDKTAYTGVEGLYACGEATGGMHGADRIGGLSSANGIVFGRITGTSAAQAAQNAPEVAPKANIALPQHGIATTDAERLTYSLKHAMNTYCMINRTERIPSTALQEIESLETDATTVSMDSRDIEKWRIELDAYAHEENGVECWLARDLMEPMGYTRWENFAEVVKRAKVSCETNKTPVDSHFRDTTKMVTAGVAARAVKDFKLTRYACYLIAQNGDPNKPEIALAQAYFAVQTRRQELIEQRFAEIQRLQARHSLSDSEKQLSGIAFKRGVDSKGFAIIKSKGDEALFGGRSTADMKRQLGVPKSAALADKLADVLIKAKDLTNSMTAFNAEEHDLYGLDQIKQEHVENNTSVRGSLIDREIVPENLPPAEDTKKLERRVKTDEKKLKEGTDGFTDPQGRLDL